jgi:hypothetical protein
VIATVPRYDPSSFLYAHTDMADPVDHNQAEPGDISFALDVEQLDPNLFQSRNLTLPFQARGVFGGQVISQALVAATRCVKPEFTLHVRFRSRTASSVVVQADIYPASHPIDSRCMYVILLTPVGSEERK